MKPQTEDPLANALLERAEDARKAVDSIILASSNTLAVGNGAALFGVLSVGLTSSLPSWLKLALVPATWVFLGGIMLGSAAVIVLGIARANLETYFQYSAMEKVGEANPDLASEKLEYVKATLKRAASRIIPLTWTLTSLNAGSALLFVAGVAWPLWVLTIAAFDGVI